jgi:hypothetical protein
MTGFDLDPAHQTLAAALGIDDGVPLADDLLAGLAQIIAGAIRQRLPGLHECRATTGRFDVATLQDTTVKTPAVLVSLVGWRARTGTGGQPHYEAQLAAFILTRDRLAKPGEALTGPRDAAALVIAQAITALVDANRWSVPALGEPFQTSAEVLVSSGSRSAALGLAVVTWLQPFTLTAAPVHDVDPVLYLDHAGEQIVIGAAP